MGSTMASNSTPQFGSFYSGRKSDELDLSTLNDLTKPHVESYDYFVERGLEEAVRRLQPMELKHPISGATLRYILFCVFYWLFVFWKVLFSELNLKPFYCTIRREL